MNSYFMCRYTNAKEGSEFYIIKMMETEILIT